jgi:hypothetical protein
VIVDALANAVAAFDIAEIAVGVARRALGVNLIDAAFERIARSENARLGAGTVARAIDWLTASAQLVVVASLIGETARGRTRGADWLSGTVGHLCRAQRGTNR